MYAGEEKTKGTDAVASALRWMKSRSPKEKLAMGLVSAILGMLLLWLIIEDHDLLFVFAEVAHFVGMGLLSYKLITKKTCVGISMRTQELTVLFLSVRLYCSFVMEYDIHTILDALTLAATGWVLYTIRFKLWHTYQQEQDNIYSYYVAVPCLLLAVLVHPSTTHWWINRVLWACCVYTEAVSVLPQLRLMQKNKVVERFVGHYVFAMGLSRFFSCAHWILQILDGNSFVFRIWGYGLWPVLVLISEIVQTFILADFCYYYVKSYADGSGVVRLPEYVV
eukprot:g8474.t1